VTLIGGEPAELIDAHWLFATICGAARRAAAAVCRCRPTIPGCRTCSPDRRGAGYLVIGETDELIADWSFRPTTSGRGGQGAAHRPALRSRAARRKDSIYRYDRAGCCMASSRPAREGTMNELLLIVTIAGSRVALPPPRSNPWSSSNA
jgi:two-component system chemotaxis sensor kinase CheA